MMNQVHTTNRTNTDAQLLALAYHDLTTSSIVNICAIIGIAFVLATRGHSWIHYLLIASLVLSAYRLLISRYFKQNFPESHLLGVQETKHWRLLYDIGLFSTSGIWVMIAFISVEKQIPQDALFTLIAIMAGMSGGAIGVLAPLKYEGRIYISMVLLSMSIAMIFATPPNYVLTFLGLILYVVLLIGHNYNHNLVKKNLILNEENTELVHNLKSINANLEHIVSERTQELKHVAHIDMLTGLANRRGLVDWINKHMAQDTIQEACVLFLDLDRFKQINDAKGHETGDVVLRQVSERFRQSLHPDSLLARWGGDEFVLILHANKNIRSVALQQAETLAECMLQPFEANGEQLGLGVSIGVAYFPADAHTLEHVIQAADLASAEVKRVGRGQVFTFTQDMAETQRYRYELGQALVNAISTGQITLEYQPVVCANTGKLVALEALARWHDPQFGNIAPEQFIALAEETDRIIMLGDLVLRKACTEAITSGIQRYPEVRIAVNVSINQLLDVNFVARITKILADTNFSPTQLALEVTESLFNDAHIDTIMDTVQTLHNMQIEIQIDDFGMGYSSLSRLHQLAISSIKIDKSFVADMENQGRVIIESAAFIARNFNCKVIAEGVETKAQAQALRKLGANFFQGYYIAAPSERMRLEDTFHPDWIGDM